MISERRYRSGELVAVACAGGAMLLTMFFFRWVFWDRFKRPHALRVREDSIKPEALITGQTEGLKGGFKKWVGGWVKEWWRTGWVACEVWVDVG